MRPQNVSQLLQWAQLILLAVTDQQLPGYCWRAVGLLSASKMIILRQLSEWPPKKLANIKHVCKYGIMLICRVNVASVSSQVSMMFSQLTMFSSLQILLAKYLMRLWILSDAWFSWFWNSGPSVALVCITDVCCTAAESAGCTLVCWVQKSHTKSYSSCHIC